MSKDKVLYKVNSQIAVTGSDFNKDNSTVSFKTRFGGIGYTEENGGVTVKTITVENTRYFVEDMGLLVAPTEKVTGELAARLIFREQTLSIPQPEQTSFRLLHRLKQANTTVNTPL